MPSTKVSCSEGLPGWSSRAFCLVLFLLTSMLCSELAVLTMNACLVLGAYHAVGFEQCCRFVIRWLFSRLHHMVPGYIFLCLLILFPSCHRVMWQGRKKFIQNRFFLSVIFIPQVWWIRLSLSLGNRSEHLLRRQQIRRQKWFISPAWMEDEYWITYRYCICPRSLLAAVWPHFWLMAPGCY